MLRPALLPIAAGLALLAGCGGGEDYEPNFVRYKSRSRTASSLLPSSAAPIGRRGDYAAVGEKIAAAAGLEGMHLHPVNASRHAFASPAATSTSPGLMGSSTRGRAASVLRTSPAYRAAHNRQRRGRFGEARGLAGAPSPAQRTSRIAGRPANFTCATRGPKYEADDLGPHSPRRLLPFSPATCSSARRNDQYMFRTRDRDEARPIPAWADPRWPGTGRSRCPTRRDRDRDGPCRA